MPAVVEGRSGVGGFLDLVREGFGLLRRSRHLRASLLFWSGLGLVVTEAFAIGVAQMDSRRTTELAAAAALVWWLLITFVLAGGAPLLVVPGVVGRRIDHYGVPNGLSALRAWCCLPLLLAATLRTPGNAGFLIWAVVGGLAGMLDFVDGWIARRVGPLTDLGRAIDPAMDALFFATAAVGCRALGIVPLWLMVLMLVRYAGPLVATPLVFLARRRPELVRTEWGRRNTALTGVVLLVLVLVRAVGGPVDAVALTVGAPLLGATTLLHFASLARRAWEAPVVRERRRP